MYNRRLHDGLRCADAKSVGTIVVARASCARASLRIVVFCLIGLAIPGRAERDVNRSAAAQRLVAKYSKHSAVVERVLQEYYLNGYEMEKAHGLNGLLALDALGVDALFLNQRYPQVFGRALHSGGPESVQAVFTCWGPLLDIEGAKSPRVQRWLQVLASLERHQMDVLGKHPKALPAIAVSPESVCRFLDGRPAEAAEPFLFIDYSRDPKGQVASLLAGLRQAGRFANEFAEVGGFPGLMCYCAHSELLDALVPRFGLSTSYAIVQANAADLASLYEEYSVAAISTALLPYASSNEKSRAVLEELTEAPFGIRLLIEFKEIGAECLASTHAEGASLLYDSYADTEKLKGRAVRILAEGKLVARDVLKRYATNEKFRDILLKDYAMPAVVQIARADQLAVFRHNYAALPEKEKSLSQDVTEFLAHWSRTGEGEIDMIAARGAEHVDSDLSFVEFLPGYDVVKLIRLLSTGKVPTSGEWAWATIDAGFLVVDICTLGGATPLTTAARKAAQINGKQLGRTGTRKLMREITEELTQMAGKQGLDSVDDLALAAARIGARRAGRSLSAGQLKSEAHLIARNLPRRLFFSTLRGMAASTINRKEGVEILGRSLNAMSLDDVSRLSRPSMEALGLRILRSGPRKLGGQFVRWVQVVPRHQICCSVAKELAQNTAGYLAMSHLCDVLDWIHRMEEADEVEK